MSARRLAAGALLAGGTGVSLILAGVALVYPPAAFVLGGLVLVAGAAFVLTRDLDLRGRR